MKRGVGSVNHRLMMRKEFRIQYNGGWTENPPEGRTLGVNETTGIFIVH